uniref:hypothetical protein n=1 Tax=Streptomyces sp. NBC_01177 TaxID=2903761 RepID=UPI002F917E76|nr:hypothetical protein OG284_36655 [Streptomyces sp. NBC_01177]
MHDRIRDPQSDTPTRNTERRMIAVGVTTHRDGRTTALIATPGAIAGTITPTRCALAPSEDARAALDTIAGCLTTERPGYAMTGPDRRRLARLYAAAEYGVGEVDGEGETLERELLRHMPPITNGFTTRRAYAEKLRPAARS